MKSILIQVDREQAIDVNIRAIAMKQCSKCRQLKELALFPKNLNNSDGFGSWCKACVAQNTKAYFKTERGREKLREAQKRYFASGKGKEALGRAIHKLQEKGYYRFGKGGFQTLKQGAVKRGLRFLLTEAELESWWTKTADTCVYCGLTMDRYRELRDAVLSYKGDDWEIRKFMRFYRSPKHRSIDWMTIDRADNSRGYELENIVKCCWICNSLKSDFFTPNEIRTVGAGVIERLEMALVNIGVLSSTVSKAIGRPNPPPAESPSDLPTKVLMSSSG